MQEEERERVKECKYCRNFTRYYTKGASRFERADCGECRNSRTTVKNSGSCEKWEPGRRNEWIIKRPIKRVLNEILEQLKQLRQIIEEGEERKQ